MSTGNQILVVDDNPTVRRFVTSILQPLGYKVLVAADGIEALSKVSRQPPDMIMLDLVMPRMNGYQFLLALQQKGLAPNAKIVILSSAREQVAQKVKEATRVEEALPKPVKAQQLRELVSKYLPLVEEAGPSEEVEFDIEPDVDFPEQDQPPEPPGGVIDENAFSDEATSDDTVSTHLELVGILRDKLDSAVAEGLAARLDEIVNSSDKDEVLVLIAEVLAMVVNDRLVERMIDLVRSVDHSQDD